MEYTEKFNFRLPQTTDDVSIADINFNTQEIEEALITAVMDSEAIQAVWGSDSPEETTVSGAFAKLALSIPVEMGEEEQVLTVTEDGVVWETPLRCVTGTYIGAGSTTISLALPFKPKRLDITERVVGTSAYLPHHQIFNAEYGFANYTNGSYYPRNAMTSISYDDGVLTMVTAVSNILFCCNNLNKEYLYVAIG